MLFGIASERYGFCDQRTRPMSIEILPSQSSKDWDVRNRHWIVGRQRCFIDIWLKFLDCLF